MLQLFTASKCYHTVHLAGVNAVSINGGVAWFVMELLDWDNMEKLVHNPARGPISDLECINACPPSRCLPAIVAQQESPISVSPGPSAVRRPCARECARGRSFGRAAGMRACKSKPGSGGIRVQPLIAVEMATSGCESYAFGNQATTSPLIYIAWVV